MYSVEEYIGNRRETGPARGVLALVTNIQHWHTACGNATHGPNEESDKPVADSISFCNSVQDPCLNQINQLKH